MKIKLETVKAASLVLDFNLYPRNSIPAQNVRDIVHAMQAGATLPPIVAEAKTRRVVDGFNRTTAALKMDTDATIDVEWRTYDNDGALLLDAIALNAAHGQKFSSYDVARAITLAETLSINPDLVADALHMTKEHIESIRATKTAIHSGQIVPIKRTLFHLAGGKITNKQMAGNEKAVGHHQVFLVNQVINLIESDLLDLSNAQLMERVQVLAGMLAQFRKRAKSA